MEEIKLPPYCLKIRDLLEQHTEGLTNSQMAVLTGYTPHAIRQAVYLLRRAGIRVRADRVFRLRRPTDSTHTEA